MVVSARIVLILLVVSSISGCLERKETITVERDGAVHMTLEFSTRSLSDLYEGDAIPTFEDGWIVEEWVVTDDDDEDTFHLKAERAFDVNSVLPSDYAGPDHGFPGAVLRFPTQITFEPRDRGTYVHFLRAYEKRDWAWIERPVESIQKQIEKRGGGRSFDELSEAERRALIAAVARVELVKHVGYARRAWDDVSPEAPQDAWLALRADMRGLVDSLDYAVIAELVLEQTAGEDELVEAELDRRLAEFDARIVKTLQDSLRETDWYSSGRVREFMRRFEFHKACHDITTDLGDDNFNVTVNLPGTIVGHNGDSSTVSSVSWNFGGAMMRDRAVVLRASAFIASP